MFGKLTYIKTPTVDVVDDYFGTKVPDPYRWLEDDQDSAVLEWTGAQHDVTMELLTGLAGRDTFERRLKEVWDYPKFDLPRRRGDRLFYLRNDGLNAQPKLYVRDGDYERVLIDPNTLSDDGTIAIFDWRPTADGRLVLYALSESGMDWLTFRVRDVDSGEDLPDKIENIKFSLAHWRPDGSGFYYSRFEADAQDEGDDNQEVSQQLYLHKLGRDQADDELVYAHPDIKGVTLSSEVSSRWGAISSCMCIANRNWLIACTTVRSTAMVISCGCLTTWMPSTLWLVAMAISSMYGRPRMRPISA